jgi:tetratricopeptide (TPR) repeat protein
MHHFKLSTIIFNISFGLFLSLYAQQQESLFVKDDVLVTQSQGTAFLGSGITEEDAKIIATNEAKRHALEQAGMYLESHTTVINFRIVKDEIITISGGIVKTTILSENRKIINNMFAITIEIEASIDLKVLNDRIAQLRENREIEEQLNIERQRNKELEAKIRYLNQNINATSTHKVKELVNALSATEWNRLGLETEDFILKIEYFTKAITLDPRYVTAYYNRGSTYNEYQKYREAIKDFNQAIELNPEYGKAYNNRGYAHNNLGKYEEAIQDFNQAIELNPYLMTVYNNRGAAYQKVGKFDQAIRDLNKAIELNPKDATSYNNRGFAFTDLGNYHSAIQDFNQAIQLDPQDPTIYYNRGCGYLQLKKYNEALADFDRSIELDPQDATAYYNRASTFYMLKRYDNAIQDYTKAIKFNPHQAVLYKNRGIIFMIMEQNKNAADDFNHYLRLNGNKFGDADTLRQMIIDLGYSPRY